ncbi:hypothetical protein A3860_36615 [Niastella vici]|uniref:HTH araC/xylS-type domain-containing protein n=1 Tax=Niastella vici TaxID=1703345 RepID=A0A1V9FMW0_9BACT|nr:AraC family transcriptional regulator [Niastella vici]OQP59694.1 hypothetical protein A3860_36615 [Niastella vici]
MTNEKKFRKHVIKAAGTYKTLLDDHCALGDKVAELSSLLGISRNVLQQAFKKQYGKGVRDYKLMTRMERGRQLLQEGKDVKAIALALNYSKPRAFTTAFKKYFAITPTDFVKQLRILKKT